MSGQRASGGIGPGEGQVVLTCDAVLFDMDGTLVDSRAIVERMWVLWADEHGIPHDKILAVAHGRRTLDTMRMVAPPHIATPEEAERLDAREAEEEGGEVAIPGAAELLSVLPSDRWAVVTSAYHAIAARRIGLVGLPVPRVLIGAEDVRAGKPDPLGYRTAAEQLRVSPSRCVVLEDTEAGIQAGRAAGAFVIGVLTTYPVLEGADWLVRDLRDVRADVTASGEITLSIIPA